MYTYALDRKGTVVTAEQAINGEDYCCPHCHAKMRVRKSTNRRSHFFLHADKHKSKECAEIEKEKHVVRDLTLLSVNKFIGRLSSVPCVGVAKKSNSTHSETIPVNEALPPNSLRQLQVCGACQMSPNTPIAGGILSALLLTYRSFRIYLSRNQPLGPRVLELKPVSAQNGRIRYVGFWKDGNQSYRAFFEHDAANTVDFEAVADELFAQKAYRYGHPVWGKPKYKRVLVAGTWVAMTKHQCSRLCGYCHQARTICSGMQYAELCNRSQIYYSDLPDNQDI
ncbi:MAG: hypothetical protein IJV82_02980 [Oscillospiraceae bacterium]|nr:hypothetical protein [Oscillospiraceae bacterium]